MDGGTDGQTDIQTNKSDFIVRRPTNAERPKTFCRRYQRKKRLTVCYYHATYEFQSKSTLYSLPECQGPPCLKQAPYLIQSG